MPDYEIETNQGKFRVTLKDLPKNPEELSRRAREMILSGAAQRLEAVGPILTQEGAEQEATRMTSELMRPQPFTLGQGFQDVGSIAGPAILPTIGQIGGGLAGGLVASPSIGGIPAGVLGGEAAGGAAGEALNQLLGITEPSASQIGLAGAAGPFGRAIGGVTSKIGRFTGRRLPGGAVVLQEEAVGIAKGISKGLQPARAADELFALIEQTSPNIRIPMPNLKATAQKLLKEEALLAEGLKGSQITRTAKGLISKVDEPKRALASRLETAQASRTSPILGPSGEALESPTALAEIEDVLSQLSEIGESLSPNELRAQLRRIGQRTGSLQGTQATETRDAFKALFSAIHDDLDKVVKAGGVEGVSAAILRTARDAVRREKSILDLADLIESGIRKGRGDFLEEINPKKILNAFDSKKFRVLRETFTKDEQEQIRSILKGLKGLPKLPPETGIQAGSMRVVGRAIIAGGIGGMTGQPMLTFGLPVAAELVARASTTGVGRSLLKKLLQPSGFLDQRAMSILAAFVRSQTAQEGENTGGPE